MTLRLVLDEDEQMMADAASSLCEDMSPSSRVRQLRDDADPLGWSRQTWGQLAELGWLGADVAEDHGGTGLGFFSLCLLLQAAGRVLMPEPLHDTLVTGSHALRAGARPDLRAEWLARVASGDAVVGFAHDERGARFTQHHTTTTARRAGTGWRLDGDKSQVGYAAGADAIVVSARAAGGTRDRDGIVLFLVEAGSAGLRITPQTRIDGRPAALVQLRDVQVPDSHRLGPAPDTHGQGGAADLLDAILDRGRIALAAEMLGVGERAFEMTLGYLKERVQFGVPIGSFQALQHRAARLFIELSLLRSAVLAAARSVDDAPVEVPQYAALAQAKASEVLSKVCAEAIQMHGGIGMTDEHDIGFYLKRALVCGSAYGDAPWHRSRWAALGGYG